MVAGQYLDRYITEKAATRFLQWIRLTCWAVHTKGITPNGVTVKETFVIRNISGTEEGLLEIWEHIRRFMEEGPEEVYAHTKYSLPLWDRREPFWYGFMANMHGCLPMQIVLSPLFLIFNVGRYFASRTSKIPVWPQEVEEACTTEPNDPYNKDWRSNPKSLFE
nr:DUF6708 domain-containing protein [uncultured Holophaga sp.]